MIVRGSGSGDDVAYLTCHLPMPTNISKEEEQAPPSVRAATPPPHVSAPTRKIVAPQFTTFQPRNFYRSGNDCINKIAWSCDGKRLASCSNSKEVKLWDIERSLDNADLSLSGSNKDHSEGWPDIFLGRAALQERALRPLSVDSVTYAPDAQTVLAMDRMDNMRIIDCRMVGPNEPNEWSLREELLRLGSDAGGDSVYQAIFNHVGDMAFLAKEDGQITMVEYPSLNIWHSLPAHVTACYTLALDPRGNYLASGGADGFVNLFDTTEFIASKTVPTIDSGIRTIAFSYDGEYLAAGCAEQSSVYIICTETGELMHRIPCLGTPSTVAWHPTRHLLAFGGDNEYSPASRGRWLSVFGS
ncbi:hypothetical protein RSAG8_00844, partial [Rhizoctonia solani AG-8 WAC10335]